MDSMTILTIIPSILLTTGLTVLSFSVIQKTWANLVIRTGRTELFGIEISDWIVILTELFVVSLGIWLPFPYSNLIMGLYFLALLGVAFILRGTQCNCFGISENSIDSVHLSLLSIISTANLASTFIKNPIFPTSSVFWGLLVGVLILLIWQHKRASSHRSIELSLPSNQDIDFEFVSGITIFTQQTCNSCRVLKSILKDRDFFVPLIFEDEKNSDLARTHRVASFPTALVHFREDHPDPRTRQLNGIAEIVGFLAKGRM